MNKVNKKQKKITLQLNMMPKSICKPKRTSMLKKSFSLYRGNPNRIAVSKQQNKRKLSANPHSPKQTTLQGYTCT